MIIRSFFRDQEDDKGGSGEGAGAGDIDTSNAAIKASPLFQKLAADLKTEREGREVLEQEKADREATEQAAAEEVEKNRLKDAGLFDEMEAKYKAKDEAKDASHAAELQRRDIQAALLQSNFRNKKFISGSVADYNAEKDGTVDEYVAALAADEANAAFIIAPGAAGGKLPPKPPGKNNVDGATMENWEEVKSWENSGNREERLKAGKLLGEYHQKHGKYPYERT